MSENKNKTFFFIEMQIFRKIWLPIIGSHAMLMVACVASVSSRGSSRKLGQERKKKE